MITLQSIMLIALGFLLASLVFIMLSSAYRSRIVRLTTEDIRRSIPITEAEIRADKDKMRAQFAIRIHKLEAQSEQQRLSAARQRIEMNRRDARIAELDTELDGLRANLEENVNARRVLEHTVTDRLPRLEQQLDGARRLIEARDQEMAALKSETTRSVRALDEAMQINAQQRAELERVKSTLSRNVDRGAGSRFDGELALRSELELLRTTAREQGELIARLQGAAGRVGGGPIGAAEFGDAGVETAASFRDDMVAAESRIEELTSRLDEQGAEVARLKAALLAYEAAEPEAAEGAGKDSRMVGKARVNSLQAQLTAQNETILKLRSELAASNERLARQAAHFMDELRRLGSGTVQTSVGGGRGREAAAQRGLSSRLVEARGEAGGDETGRGGRGQAGASRRLASGATAAGGAARGPTSSRIAAYLRTMTDGSADGRADAGTEAVPGREAEVSVRVLGKAPGGAGGNGAAADDGEERAERPAEAGARASDTTGAAAAGASEQAAISALAQAVGAVAKAEAGVGERPAAAARGGGGGKQRSNLLDRISGLGKS